MQALRRRLILAVLAAPALRARAQQQARPVEFTVGGLPSGARVRGQLRVPASATPVGAVLIVTSTPGFDGRSAFYAEALQAAGLATLEADLFQGRGAPESPRENLPQAFEALRWLGTQPGLDGSRIGIMGFSWGGSVALLAAFEDLAQAADPQRRFAAHLALYPVCWKHHATLTRGKGAWRDIPPGAYGRATGRPVHVLVGDKDDYDDGAHGCEQLLGALPGQARRHVALTVLPGATFAWDSRHGSASFSPNVARGKGGIFKVVADPALALQSRRFATGYFGQHLRAA